MESFNIVVKLTQFFLWCLEVSQDKSVQGYQCHLAPHWEKGTEHDICCCQPNYLFPTCLLQLFRGPVNSSTLQHVDFEVEKKGYITDCFADESGCPSVRDGRWWAQVNVLGVEKLAQNGLGCCFLLESLSHMTVHETHRLNSDILKSYCQPFTIKKSSYGWSSLVNLLSLWGPRLCVRFKSQSTYQAAYLSEADTGSSLWR